MWIMRKIYYVIYLLCTLIKLLCSAENVTNMENSSSVIQNDYIHIRAVSNWNKIAIFVDSKQVMNYFTEGEFQIAKKGRMDHNGLHIVVLNPRSGNIITKKLFGTEYFAEVIGIAPLLKFFTDGELFIIAVKFDAGLNLSRSIRRLFRAAGAAAIFNVTFRSYFIWIFSKGGKTFIESFIEDDPTQAGDFMTSPVLADVFVPKLKHFNCWSTSTHLNPVELRRANFCLKYGGYGQLCDCEDPLNIWKQSQKIQNSVVENAAILVMAGGRPISLFKCLITLLSQPGSNRHNILVFLDGHNSQVEELLQVFQISYHVTHLDSYNFTKLQGYGVRISTQYKLGLLKGLEKFPNSDYFIVLEEDILVSPDFLRYMNQTALILSSDPSLYCVNAWNDLSAMHTIGGNPHKVMRMETQPSYGWMVTREFLEGLQLQTWFPEHKKMIDWDIWFRGLKVRGGRECIVPEISRSFHMGESGVHIKGQVSYSHFVGHLTTMKADINLHNVDRMREELYEEDLFTLLESDKVIFMNSTFHPCVKDFIPKNLTDKIVVIFLSMYGTQDSTSWHRFASCLGVFDMDTRNNHRGLFQFYFYHTRVFAIGYPYSDYSYLKPPFAHLINGGQSEWDKKNLQLLALMNRRRFRVPEVEAKMPYPFLLGRPKGAPIFKYVTT